MKVKILGLGKMGFNLALNMKDNGIKVIGYDIDDSVRNKANLEGLETVDKLEEVFSEEEKNIVWVMLPAGEITNSTLSDLISLANEGDYIIDGGNSDHRDSVKFGKKFEEKGVFFFDFGTSGGVYGARNGASFMCGGDNNEFRNLVPLLEKISLNSGYVYTGKAGSGHYLKIIHNAMLYGYMQTLGEGFELLEASEFDYNLEEVARSLGSSSVIRGWLLELLAEAFNKDARLEDIVGEVGASKTTKWTLESACELGVPIPVIYDSLMMRYRSKQNESFSAKVVASLRNEVGGHKPKEK